MSAMGSWSEVFILMFCFQMHSLANTTDTTQIKLRLVWASWRYNEFFVTVRSSVNIVESDPIYPSGMSSGFTLSS